MVQKLFEPRRTPQQNMLIAVSDADADIRRQAVAKVADSDLHTHDWAVRGFVAIALLESDPHARCVAIRGLARGGDVRAAAVCLKILNHREFPPVEVREPEDVVRWEACNALAELCAREAVPEPDRPRARESFMTLLLADANRNVRIAAARGLASFPDREVLGVLIEGLRDPEFAVTHACERSLAELTGLTHQCSVVEWQKWLASEPADPFARAGQLPESMQPPYDTKLEKMAYDTRQVVEWLWPGRKKE